MATAGKPPGVIIPAELPASFLSFSPTVKVEVSTATIVKESIDHAIEVAKARLTLRLFLGGTVTVTGLRFIPNPRNGSFLPPPHPGRCDLMLKHRYTSVFMYQAAALAEVSSRSAELTAMTFLDFERAEQSPYAKILRIEVICDGFFLLSPSKQQSRETCCAAAALSWRR